MGTHHITHVMSLCMVGGLCIRTYGHGILDDNGYGRPWAPPALLELAIYGIWHGTTRYIESTRNDANDEG